MVNPVDQLLYFDFGLQISWLFNRHLWLFVSKHMVHSFHSFDLVLGLNLFEVWTIELEHFKLVPRLILLRLAIFDIIFVVGDKKVLVIFKVETLDIEIVLFIPLFH